jgi:ABC-type tungstate transport system substrate-binding protein
MMKNKTALSIISIISGIGVLFSGYLTFTELTAKTCGLGGCQAILGLPTCMYGLVMYLAIFALSMIGKN